MLYTLNYQCCCCLRIYDTTLQWNLNFMSIFFFSFPCFKCFYNILCKIVLQINTSEVCFESFKDFRIILNPLMDQAGSMSFSSRVRLNRYILNYNQSSTCVAWHQYRKTCVEIQLLKERTTYRSRKMIWYICLSNTSSVCSTSVHAQVAQTKKTISPSGGRMCYMWNDNNVEGVMGRISF